ncbi:unnamed protein product [Closterium sp. NIES-54]
MCNSATSSTTASAASATSSASATPAAATAAAASTAAAYTSTSTTTSTTTPTPSTASTTTPTAARGRKGPKGGAARGREKGAALGAATGREGPLSLTVNDPMPGVPCRLRHRGRDWSVHTFGNNFLAHERLADIDPASGHQPLRNEDGSIVVAGNGEIYNYQQLRDELLLRDELQHRDTFNTDSDCQVIAHLYEDVGDAVVQKLDGIFAFVLLNTKDGSYIAARDHIGVCPLYIGWGRDGSLWFAFEMKALKDDCEQFETFLPSDVYSSKAKMPRRWYNPTWYDEHIPSAPYDPIALRAAFEKAVVKRLMTDVPFGVLLSGGLDSSLVAAVTQRHLGNQGARLVAPRRRRADPFGFNGSGEAVGGAAALLLRRPRAREVADFIGTNHHEINFTVQEGIDAISEVIYHTETFDVATIRASTPMFLLSCKIKALGVKMVLSGEGSDEVFGGYLYFHKAPSKEDFHWETCRKLKALHVYDCLRAKKATWIDGLKAHAERMVSDQEMANTPNLPCCSPPLLILYLSPILCLKHPYPLYQHILYRQKEQFSDGVEYSWIDGLKAHAERSRHIVPMVAHRSLPAHSHFPATPNLFTLLLFLLSPLPAYSLSTEGAVFRWGGVQLD